MGEGNEVWKVENGRCFENVAHHSVIRHETGDFDASPITHHLFWGVVKR